MASTRPADSVGFLFLGDWGSKGNEQLSVAKQMATYADNPVNDVEFVLALGDNFYRNDGFGTHDGVADAFDPQWEDVFRSVYRAESLQVPWYAVLGNHDYHGNPEAQIDYYRRGRDGRWVMPDHCYSERWFLDGRRDPLLEIVFVDTTVLSPTVIADTSKGGKYEVTKEVIRAMLVSVEKMLSRSRASWLFVCGHYTGCILAPCMQCD